MNLVAEDYEQLQLSKLKLQVEMVKHLLKYRFTWEEIFLAIGCSEEWLSWAEKTIEEHEKGS